MPFNGSGTFQRVRNWMQDAAANIRIRADRHDSEDDNFAQGLSQCITKDGQTTITANLPMANYRHTNVGEAQAINQYARYDQLQLGKAVWAAAGGTADAITASYSPNTIDPIDGQLYYVRASAANATTTPTFAPDGTTAQIITKYGADPLVAGDISGAGHELILRYRLSDTKYELLNPAVTGVPTLSGNNTFAGDNTFTGDVRFPNDGTLVIASGAITVTGVYHTIDTEASAATDDLETINGGVSGQILILRTADSSRDVVLKSTGNIDLVADVTLASIDSPIELIYDGATSKWLQRAATAAQGALADTAVQPSDLIFRNEFVSSELTITANENGTIAHGLGVRPKIILGHLVCKTAEGGYSINDEVEIFGLGDLNSNSQRSVTLVPNATNIYYIYGSGQIFFPSHKTTGATFVFTPSNWRMVLRAYA